MVFWVLFPAGAGSTNGQGTAKTTSRFRSLMSNFVTLCSQHEAVLDSLFLGHPTYKNPFPQFEKSRLKILVTDFLFSSHRYSHPRWYTSKLQMIKVNYNYLTSFFPQVLRIHYNSSDPVIEYQAPLSLVLFVFKHAYINLILSLIYVHVWYMCMHPF